MTIDPKAELEALKRHGPVLAVLVFAWFILERPNPAPLPAKQQHTIDSLFITQPLDSVLVDSLKRAGAKSAQEAAIAHAKSQQDSVRAEAIARQVDSLATTARQTKDWYPPFVAESSLVVQQRVTLTSKTEENVKLAEDTLSKAIIISHLEPRLDAAMGLIPKLQQDVKKAGECNILPFVRCPTRKETALLTFVATVGTYVAVRK